MKLAALAGFATGTLIALWSILRSLSHGETELDPDPLDEIQWDPRLGAAWSSGTTRHFLLDCE